LTASFIACLATFFIVSLTLLSLSTSSPAWATALCTAFFTLMASGSSSFVKALTALAISFGDASAGDSSSASLGGRVSFAAADAVFFQSDSKVSTSILTVRAS
jgi:hypothetical protein